MWHQAHRGLGASMLKSHSVLSACKLLPSVDIRRRGDRPNVVVEVDFEDVRLHRDVVKVQPCVTGDTTLYTERHVP